MVMSYNHSSFVLIKSVMKFNEDKIKAKVKAEECHTLFRLTFEFNVSK